MLHEGIQFVPDRAHTPQTFWKAELDMEILLKFIPLLKEKNG